METGPVAGNTPAGRLINPSDIEANPQRRPKHHVDKGSKYAAIFLRCQADLTTDEGARCQKQTNQQIVFHVHVLYYAFQIHNKNLFRECNQ